MGREREEKGDRYVMGWDGITQNIYLRFFGWQRQGKKKGRCSAAPTSGPSSQQEQGEGGNKREDRQTSMHGRVSPDPSSREPTGTEQGNISAGIETSSPQKTY